MKPTAVRDLGFRGVQEALAGAGLRFACGPFVVELRSTIPALAPALATRFGDYPLSDEAIVDFAFSFRRATGRFGFVTKQIIVARPGAVPHQSAGEPQALALLESALMQAIDETSPDLAVTRAAVLERGGFALVLPGAFDTVSPLAAALVARGWRLFSAARALTRLDDGALLPLPLPLLDETPQGALTASALARPAEHVRTRWLVFAENGRAAPSLEPLPKARALFRLVEATVNRETIGMNGFDRLARTVDAAGCYRLSAAALDDAAAALDALGRSPSIQVA